MTMWIHSAGVRLEADLSVPVGAAAVVLFAQAGPRDQAIAAALRESSLATMLIEPLTPDERADEARRFDIDLVADRLIGTLRWLRAQPTTAQMPVGLFGAGVNGGAVLVAAAARPGDVQAVVTRGGRVDLAGGALAQLQAPTLLIVGERDEQLLAINDEVRRLTRAHADLCLIPGADRYFRDARALEQVTIQAADWFTLRLATPLPVRAPAIDTALPVDQGTLGDVLVPPTPTQSPSDEHRSDDA